jgi:hypothetical protein
MTSSRRAESETSERRLAAVLREHWPTLVFFVAALALRLHWNLSVHPPADYVYSDMRGYMDRAAEIFEDPWAVREYNAFYPYGTHVLLYAVQAGFGRGNHVALGGAYAVLGAILTAYGHVLARLVSERRVVHLAVGTLLVGYYPLVSLGGYYLSEIPFSLCLTASTVHLLRIVRTGRTIDAVAMGSFLAMGFTLRPQILLSCALVGVLWLVLRKGAWHRVGVQHFGIAAIPIVVVMAFSAWRLHHHTGRYGLISENGTFNRVFGRCHVKKITAIPDRPPRRRTSFGPPPLIQLHKRAERAPGQWPQLEPAMGLEFEYRGYIGDDDIHRAYMAQCVDKTGWMKQAEYGVVHMVMLWRHNIMWPDSGNAAWQGNAHRWGLFVTNVLCIPALLAMFAFMVPRRFPALAVLAAHLWALHVMAALYLGGSRFRAPYDPFVVVMALEVYAGLGALAWRWLVVRRSRGDAAGESTDTAAA